MSLARGFFIGGAKSVLSSLWSINDKSSKEIVVNFYSFLKRGESKSRALYHAKLKYLKNHSQSEISPYYWSSFILIGDDGKINLINSHSHLYITMVIVVLGIFLLVFILKRLKKYFSRVTKINKQHYIVY